MTKLNLGINSNENRAEYQRRYNTYRTCICGRVVKKLTYYNHLTTERHKLLMELLERKTTQ